MMVPTGVAEAYDGPRRGKRGGEVDERDVVLVHRCCVLVLWEGREQVHCKRSPADDGLFLLQIEKPAEICLQIDISSLLFRRPIEITVEKKLRDPLEGAVRADYAGVGAGKEVELLSSPRHEYAELLLKVLQQTFLRACQLIRTDP